MGLEDTTLAARAEPMHEFVPTDALAHGFSQNRLQPATQPMVLLHGLSASLRRVAMKKFAALGDL